MFLQNMYYYKFNIMNINEGDGNWAVQEYVKKILNLFLN